MLKLFTISLAAFQIQVAISQCVGRQPITYKPQIQETVVESPTACQQIQTQPAVIENTSLPVNQVTLITDCTPSVCKNLANTIQLMIVVDLLKNSKGSNMPADLALSLLNDITSSPSYPCGCSNPLFSNSNSNMALTANMFSSVNPKFNTNSFYTNFIPNIKSGMPGFVSFSNINPNIVF